MSIYEKLDTAIENNDAKAYADLLHDDFQFVRHATNTAMTKSEWVKVISNMMESGKVTRSNSRCIYENDDVLVSHSLVSFPDGSSEAVLVCFTLSNGKIIRSEGISALIRLVQILANCVAGKFMLILRAH